MILNSPSAVDYLALSSKLNKPTSYPISEVKDQLKKVAFDVVRFVDGSNIEGLWKIESRDGEDYIVAMYPEDTLEKSASTNFWSSTLTDDGINISYKNIPVKKLAFSDLSTTPERIYQLHKDLPNKLASNSKLVKTMISEISMKDQLKLFSSFPELKDIVKEGE